MVKIYSLKKDGEKKLSEHFRVKEFKCKDGSDKILISDELVALLEKIRTYFGKPIHINSAYRTSAYNRQIGGASASQHVKGTAADIVVESVPPSAVAAWAEKYNTKGGSGNYSTFTHVDVRGYKVLWFGSNSSKSVSSFKLGNVYEKYKAKESTVVVTSKESDGDDMTYTEFKEFMERYESDKAKKATSSYAKDSLAWARKNGIIKGDTSGNLMPKSYITREDLAVVLKRYDDLNSDDNK